MVGSVARDLLTLPLLASLEKSKVSGNLKYCHDLHVKGLGNLNITSGDASFILLCVTCSNKFNDHKDFVYALQSGGCSAVFFVACYCKGLV